MLKRKLSINISYEQIKSAPLKYSLLFKRLFSEDPDYKAKIEEFNVY